MHTTHPGNQRLGLLNQVLQLVEVLGILVHAHCRDVPMGTLVAVVTPSEDAYVRVIVQRFLVARLALQGPDALA